MENILIKKCVIDVVGALDYMKAVGFQEQNGGPKKQYLVIEEAEVTILKAARALSVPQLSQFMTISGLRAFLVRNGVFNLLFLFRLPVQRGRPDWSVLSRC